MVTTRIPEATAVSDLPMIAARQSQLVKLCKKFHIRRLELFGSALSGAFDPACSDLDFLVEFEPLPPIAYASAFFGFKEALEQLFGRPADLVIPSAVRNPYFRQSIEQNKALLYAA